MITTNQVNFGPQVTVLIWESGRERRTERAANDATRILQANPLVSSPTHPNEDHSCAHQPPLQAFFGWSEENVSVSPVLELKNFLCTGKEKSGKHKS